VSEPPLLAQTWTVVVLMKPNSTASFCPKQTGAAVGHGDIRINPAAIVEAAEIVEQ